MTLKVPLGIASQVSLRGALLPIKSRDRVSLVEGSVFITPSLRSRELIRSPKYPQPQFSTSSEASDTRASVIIVEFVTNVVEYGKATESTPRPLD